MPKDLMDLPEHGAEACARSAVETEAAEDFSFLIWQEIFRAIIRNEKQALESSKAVGFEVEVKQSDGLAKERIIKIEVVCEPGKPPRLSYPLQTQCASHEHTANASKNGRPKKV